MTSNSAGPHAPDLGHAPIALSQRAVDDALQCVLEEVALEPTRLDDVLGRFREPLIAFTPDRIILAANPSAERFFGYERRALDGRPTDDIVPPRLRQPDAPPMLATKDLMRVDVPGLRRDGTEISASWTVGSVVTPGEPIFVMIIRDRMQLEDALEALRASEERYRLLVEGFRENERRVVIERTAREAAEAAEERMRRVHGMALVLSRATTPAEVAAAVLDECLSEVGAVAGAVYVVSEDGRALELLDQRGHTPASLEGFERIDLEVASPMTDAARTSTPTFYESASEWRSRYSYLGEHRSPYEASVVLPLRARGRLLGVLGVRYGVARRFDDLTRALFATFGELCAQSLDRALVLAAEQRARAETQRIFMEAPFEVTILRGPELVIELANQMALESLGKGREIIGKPLLDACPELRGQPLAERPMRVLETGEVFDARGELTRVNQGAAPLRDAYWNRTYTPLHDGGAVRGVMTFAVDVTDQVTAERRYRALAEANVVGVVIASEAGVVDANDAFLRMVRRTREDLGRPISWATLTAPEHAQLDERALDDLKERGVCEPFEKELLLSDGTRVPVLIAGARLERSEPLTWICLTLDLTELRRAQAELRAMNERLIAADRSKDEFLATMSHELRTPLNAILGWATILNRKPREMTQLDRGLDVIERNARAQERLVSDLLDVSRIISGKLRIRLQRTNVWSVVQAAVDVVRPAAETKGVRVLVDVDPEVGTMMADPERLQQVIWNLLVNAIRFTPRGGRVTVITERVAAGIRIRVEDTGAGIEPTHLPFIFDRFRQVDSSITRRHGGLGLGLAIVRHLVEAHGGYVEADSAGPGRGATFTIILPIQALDLSSAEDRAENEHGSAAEEARSDARAPGPRLDHVRILLVDDERDALELVSVVLQAAGAEVTTAQSAFDALAALGPFDIIVSDIGLPEMDGYEVMRRIRARGHEPPIPAVALTAYARAEDAESARAAGFQEHLAKPIDPERLIDAVSRWTRPPESVASPAPRAVSATPPS